MLHRRQLFPTANEDVSGIIILQKVKVYAIEINTIAIVCCVPLSEVDANSQSLPAADTTDRVSDACQGNSYNIIKNTTML